MASRTPAPTFTLLSPSEAWQLEVLAVAQRSSPWLGDLNPQLLRLFLNKKMSPLYSSHLQRAAEWFHKKGKGAGAPRSTTGDDCANTSRAEADWACGQCPYPKAEPRRTLSRAALPQPLMRKRGQKDFRGPEATSIHLALPQGSKTMSLRPTRTQNRGVRSPNLIQQFSF